MEMDGWSRPRESLKTEEKWGSSWSLTDSSRPSGKISQHLSQQYFAYAYRIGVGNTTFIQVPSYSATPLLPSAEPTSWGPAACSDYWKPRWDNSYEYFWTNCGRIGQLNMQVPHKYVKPYGSIKWNTSTHLTQCIIASLRRPEKVPGYEKNLPDRWPCARSKYSPPSDREGSGQEPIKKSSIDIPTTSGTTRDQRPSPSVFFIVSKPNRYMVTQGL